MLQPACRQRHGQLRVVVICVLLTWIEQGVSERAKRHVGPLRQEHQRGVAWQVDTARAQGPNPADRPQQCALPRPRWSREQDGFTTADLEIDIAEKWRSRGQVDAEVLNNERAALAIESLDAGILA